MVSPGLGRRPAWESGGGQLGMRGAISPGCGVQSVHDWGGQPKVGGGQPGIRRDLRAGHNLFLAVFTMETYKDTDVERYRCRKILQM